MAGSFDLCARDLGMEVCGRRSSEGSQQMEYRCYNVRKIEDGIGNIGRLGVLTNEDGEQEGFEGRVGCGI